jgi:hypothetical protein
MQQLFSFVNQLLQREPATQARKLHVRGYCVVPLAPAAVCRSLPRSVNAASHPIAQGLIEWVEDCQALGNYLVNGPQSAHTRYRPKVPAAGTIFLGHFPVC